MKKLIFIILILTLAMTEGEMLNAQSVKRDDWTSNKANSWLNTGDWKNGWKPNIHPSVNTVEFAYQYHKNKALWDKAFAYLSSTNLDTLSVGKHILDGENLFISVTEAPVKDFEATKWEAHKKYIDIQYVIRGKEKMGIIPVEKTEADQPFDTAKDIGFYQADEAAAKYYEANPEVFLIFFPGDAHRPGIKIAGTDSDKKLVIKIKAD
ncbi:MAG: DUF386 domain-containing protein [Bacteroidales bacterium]|nr:DUF386 domain-containing protein [Bacteroidales bacterium]